MTAGSCCGKFFELDLDATTIDGVRLSRELIKAVGKQGKEWEPILKRESH